MKLYVYERLLGERTKEENTESLVFRALEDYRKEEGLDFHEKPTILRLHDGKPVFDRGDLHFSVSHTGKMWACLMGNRPVGLDIQKKKTTNWQRIAGRFFTNAEKDYVEKEGEDGFWKVWVAKEAYIKYLGTTLGQGLKKYSLIEKGALRSELNGLVIRHMLLTQDIYCACVMKEQEEICKRKLI